MSATPRQRGLLRPRGLAVALVLALGLGWGLALWATAIPGVTRADDAAHEVEEIRVELDGQTLYGRAAGPDDAPAVLLLHGAKFDSSTWEELGTYEVLAEAGFRGVGIDLPGFGRSRQARADPKGFLAALLPAMGLEQPVLVSPSMSGRFSFPLVAAEPERLAGFVAVAPALTPRFAKQIQGSPLPALIVWGEEDRVFPMSQAKLLAPAFENAQILILPGAQHPAYLDEPDAFHKGLLAFVEEVSARR